MYSIEARDVHKTYRIYRRPSDRLKEFLLRRPRHTEFHALRGVSFNLTPGETLGIVGDNGAGKSTLLKILAGTVTPTSGRVVKRGKAAALLELGAGFHPEFTGRQNIYINGSLMGLTDEELKTKEHHIIEFAELSEFIDQPVKTYSSGMYVRLAFSIATSIDPDILIIDEALSVGDQRFQKKCIDRMMGFKEQGKTILFCSHNMYQVGILCEKAMWLRDGRVELFGPTDEVVRTYEDYTRSETRLYEDEKKNHMKSSEPASSPCLIEDVGLEDRAGRRLDKVSPFADVVLVMRVRAVHGDVDTHFGFAIIRADDLMCFCALTTQDDMQITRLKRGDTVRVALHVRGLSLLNGTYRIAAGILDEHALHLHHVTYSRPFEVVDPRGRLGVATFEHYWSIK